MIEAGYKEISGSKIYYETTGSGDPMIFLHADTLDSRQWEEQFKYFSRKYQVIRYDMRGFGRSDIPTNEPYSFSEDLNQLMKALSLQKAHLVGLSLGGAEILNFALAHPQKVLSLVLVDSGIHGDEFEQSFKDSVKVVIDLAKMGELAKARHTWSNLSFFDVSRGNSQVWSQVEQMINDTSCYRWYGDNQPITSKPPAVERLSEIHIPTLIIVGEHDVSDFQRKAQLLHKGIHDSKFTVVPNAGHLSNMDNSDVFNLAVDTFLQNKFSYSPSPPACKNSFRNFC